MQFNYNLTIIGVFDEGKTKMSLVDKRKEQMEDRKEQMEEKKEQKKKI